MKVVRLSAIRTGRIYPQEILLVLISVRVCVETQCHSKFPMTPSVIELATFQIVGQCLNQLRYRVPPITDKRVAYFRTFILSNQQCSFKILAWYNVLDDNILAHYVVMICFHLQILEFIDFQIGCLHTLVNQLVKTSSNISVTFIALYWQILSYNWFFFSFLASVILLQTLRTGLYLDILSK